MHITYKTVFLVLYLSFVNCFIFQAVLVKIVASYIRDMPERMDLTVPRKQYQSGSNSEEDSKQSTSGETKTSSSSAASDCTGRDGSQISFSKLRQVYDLGESWFGSAFVLQLPSVYLCLHESQLPSFMESHVYQELQTTGEDLLRDALSWEENNKNRKSRGHLGGPFAKKRKTNGDNSVGSTFNLPSDSFSSLDFDSLMEETNSNRNGKLTPESAFSSYKKVVPRHLVSIRVSIQGFRVWDAATLKKPKKSTPSVTDHPHAALLNNYLSKSMVQKMPHCKFTRPLRPKLRPGYSLHNCIL